MFDLILENGLIVDGGGAKGYRADVGIMGGFIAAIGWLHDSNADRRIDAANLVVAPGFIDPHCHAEIGLLAGTSTAAVVRQGVTTQILAPDGFGYAPLSPSHLIEMRRHLASFYGEPEIGWDWQSLGQYLARFDQRVPINVVGQVSHHAIRLEVMGWDARVATTTEIDQMARLVSRAMDDGAAGFATGLDYLPGAHSDTNELVQLSRIVAERGGIYTAHQRHSLGGVVAATRETLRLARDAAIPVHISHLYGPDELFQLIEGAHKSGIDISFDAYPYTAGATHLLFYMPQWVQLGSPEEVLRRLASPAVRERLAGELPGSLGPPDGWNRYWISEGGTDGEQAIAGRSLADLAGRDNRRLVNLLCDKLVEHNLQVLLLEFWLTEAQVCRSLAHPLSMIMTDGLYVRHPHPRGYGTYPRILGRYVRETRLLSLEDAIHRMTGFPAQRFGLHDRGLIRPGLAADLVIFDPGAVIDQATYIQPELPPLGIPFVIVNGQLVVDDGQVTKLTPGRVLKPLV